MDTNPRSNQALGLSHSHQRAAVRRDLLHRRAVWQGSAEAADASARLHHHLSALLRELKPAVLGSYWPVRHEFNPRTAQSVEHDSARVHGHRRDEPWQLALPWVQRQPPTMHYRHWDGASPRSVDEVGIPASDGEPVRPDIVLAPCVGYSDTGLRLGYGGGYFDRYLSAHPDVLAIGLAPSWARVELLAEAHDVRLPIIVTDAGVLTP